MKERYVITLDISQSDFNDAVRDLRMLNPHLSKDQCSGAVAFAIAQIQQGFIEIEGGISRGAAVAIADAGISRPAGTSVN